MRKSAKIQQLQIHMIQRTVTSRKCNSRYR